MKPIFKFTSLTVVLAAIPLAYCLGASSASPATQDPVKISSDVYKVLLDNERVRVLDITLKPGAKSPMHSHPDHVIYALADGKARFTDKDGNAKEMSLTKGQCAWSDAMEHAVENAGEADVRVLNIELKEPKPLKTPPKAEKK